MYLINLIFAKPLCNNCYYPHFIEKETETQSYSFCELHDILGYALHTTP